MYTFKLIIFILISVCSLASFANDASCPTNMLGALTENKKLKELSKFLDDARINATNGIEVEGVIRFFQNSVYDITENLIDHMKTDWKGLITNIRTKSYNDHSGDGYRIYFNFKGVPKNIIINYENLPKTGNDQRFLGVELSSHIIADKDDYLLYLSLQDKFFGSGVVPESATAGIHNHVGLRATLGRTVQHALDPEIKQFTVDFKRIEDEVFDYFGTNPFRSPTSGPIADDLSPVNKSQALILSKANTSGEYLTLEFRYLNSMHDPKTLIESTNFNNMLVKKYFDPKSGVKDYLQNAEKVSLKELYKMLDLPYKKKSHLLKVLKLPFDPAKTYFDVFGKSSGKVLNFLGSYFNKNKGNGDNLSGAINQAFKYIAMLKEKHNISDEKLVEFIRRFIKAARKVIPPEKMVRMMIKAPKFRFLPENLKTILIRNIYPDGLDKLPDDELMKVLTDNYFHLIFKNYPLKRKEIDHFYRVANQQKDPLAVANTLIFKEKDLSEYIRSLKFIKGDFRLKVFEELIKIDHILSGVARAHLINLIQKAKKNS